MLKTLTLKSTLTYAVLDLLFAPFVILAFTQLLGTGAAADPWLTMGGLTVLKIATWGIYLSIELGPWERFARTTAKGRTPELAQAADRCLQSLPIRFGIVYSLTWIATYGVGFMIVKGLGPERAPLPPQADNAVAILCLAVFFGGFAFAYPMASTLTADAASECSALARAGGYSLDRSPSSLQLRIAAVAMALALGPMLWMVALGYIKQVESSHTERMTHAALASSQLALAIAAIDPIEGDARLGSVLEDFQQRNIDGLLLDAGRPRGTVAATRLLADDTELARWLEAEIPKRSSGTRARIDWPHVIAFQRVDAKRVAVAVLRAPVAASSSFVLSSIVFTLLVGVWAPVCA